MRDLPAQGSVSCALPWRFDCCRDYTHEMKDSVCKDTCLPTSSAVHGRCYFVHRQGCAWVYSKGAGPQVDCTGPLGRRTQVVKAVVWSFSMCACKRALACTGHAQRMHSHSHPNSIIAASSADTLLDCRSCRSQGKTGCSAIRRTVAIRTSSNPAKPNRLWPRSVHHHFTRPCSG